MLGFGLLETLSHWRCVITLDKYFQCAWDICMWNVLLVPVYWPPDLVTCPPNTHTARYLFLHVHPWAQRTKKGEGFSHSPSKAVQSSKRRIWLVMSQHLNLGHAHL